MIYHVSDEHVCSCWQDCRCIQECRSLTSVYTPWRIRSLLDGDCTSCCPSGALFLCGCIAWVAACCGEAPHYSRSGDR